MRLSSWSIVCVAIMGMFCVVQSVNAEVASPAYNHGMGILNIRSQSIGQSFRLTIPMLIPGDIKKGWASYASLTWTNVWAQERCYLMDYEMMDFYGGFSHGFNDRLGVAVIYDNRSYFGGALDGFIQGFHDLLGVGQNHRDDFAKDRSIIQRFDKNTGVMVEEISAHDLNNSGISALINYNLFHGTRLWPSINIDGVTRFGLENSRIINQDNKLETGFGLGLAKRWTNSIYSYGVLGYTFYNNGNSSDTFDNSLRLKKEQKNAMAALAWQVTPDCSLLAQYLYSSSVVKEIWGLEKSSHEVHLGMKYNIGKNQTLDFAIIENLITMDNSPDFGLHIAISQQF